MQSGITKTGFGTLPDGRQASLYTLVNRNGVQARITDFGGIIVSLLAPDRDGVLGDIALGFDDVTPYTGESHYLGALIGRYGNRIARGRFVLDGQEVQVAVNNGENHLHGGPIGFHKVLWRAAPFEAGDRVGLTLGYRSVDGEAGYPGNLDVIVVYELTDANELFVRFSATTDKATPVNLTQHTYFNLAGAGDILGHQLQIAAGAITPVDAGLIPTGELAPVDGTPFDFRSPQAIGARIGEDDQQLRYGQGYDHNFVLDAGHGPAVRVLEPVSGRVLELYTEEPGVQFYSGNFLDGTLSGKGRSYALRSGFCIEPQHFPDSPNQPQFPNTILRPGETYTTVSKFKFSVE